MPTFYRSDNLEDKTVYKDPELTQGFKTEEEFKAAGGIPDWGTTASQTNIKPSQLMPAELLKTVEPPTDANNYASIIAGLALPEKSAEQSESEASIKQTSTDIISLLSEQEGKGAFEAGLQEEKGVNLQEKEIQDLTNQMKSLQLESQAQQIAIAEQTKTTGHISGELTKNQRDTAIKTLMLSSQLQAKQNNYSLALNQIQRAVDLKYQPIENRIKILKEQYLMNKDALERIDKKRADETALNIKKQELLANFQKEQETREYNEKIQTAKDNNAIALKAAEGGAPASVIQAIRTATDINTAIEYASGFLDTELQKKLQEMAQTQANIDRKFKEDQRQFGLQYALDARKVAVSEMNASQMNDTSLNLSVDDWVKLIVSGQSKLTEVPNPRGSTLRSDVASALIKNGQVLLSDKDREKLSTLDTAFNVANTIKDLSAQINTFDAKERLTGMAAREAGAKLQTNPLLARYEAARKGFVSNVARTLGEKGALAEGDVQRAIENLPTMHDTKDVAEGKIATLFSILEGARKSIVQKSTEPLNKTTSGTLPDKIIEYQGKKYKVDSNGEMTPL